jgi:hypothetical protein
MVNHHLPSAQPPIASTSKGKAREDATMSSPMWNERRQVFLSRLYPRADNILRLVLSGLEKDQAGKVAFPENIEEWFQRIYVQGEQNDFVGRSEHLQSTPTSPPLQTTDVNLLQSQ